VCPFLTQFFARLGYDYPVFECFVTIMDYFIRRWMPCLMCLVEFEIFHVVLQEDVIDCLSYFVMLLAWESYFCILVLGLVWLDLNTAFSKTMLFHAKLEFLWVFY
jgi:hypothetical protein